MGVEVGQGVISPFSRAVPSDLKSLVAAHISCVL